MSDLKAMELFVELEKIALVPRNRLDPNYTFDKTEITKLIELLINRAYDEGRVDGVSWYLENKNKPIPPNIKTVTLLNEKEK